MEKIKDALVTLVAIAFVGYIMIGNIYLRVTHPEYTETQLFLTIVTYGYYDIDK